MRRRLRKPVQPPQIPNVAAGEFSSSALTDVRTTQKQNMRSFYKDSRIATLLFLTFLLKIASYLAVPFMLVFLVQVKGVPLWAGGILVGLYQAGSVVTGMTCGILAQRFGSWTIMVGSIILSAVVHFSFFVLAYLPLGHLVFIVAFGCLSVVCGVASALFWPISQAAMAEYASPKTVPYLFGHRYFLVNLAAAIGPPLGAIAGAEAGAGGFLASGICYVVAGIVYLRLADGSMPARDVRYERIDLNKLTQPFANVQLKLVILTTFCFLLGYSQISSNLSQTSLVSPTAGLSFAHLLAINGATILICQPFLTPILVRFDHFRVIAFGNALFLIACLLPVVLSSCTATALTFVVVASIAEIFVVPSGSVLIDDIAPANMRQAYFAVATLRNVGQVLGPPIGAAALDKAGPVALFSLMAASAIGAGLVAAVLSSSGRHRDRPPV